MVKIVLPYGKEKIHLDLPAENIAGVLLSKADSYIPGGTEEAIVQKALDNPIGTCNLWESQARIKEVGYEKWYMEKIEQYSCPECHIINSAYDIECRNCGVTPSCNYVKSHKSEIVQSSTKIKL